jgi:hypothetical protein
MRIERFKESAARLQQLASEKAYRRWSNLSLIKDMLIAVSLLGAIGAVLSLGSLVLR